MHDKSTGKDHYWQANERVYKQIARVKIVNISALHALLHLYKQCEIGITFTRVVFFPSVTP